MSSKTKSKEARVYKHPVELALLLLKSLRCVFCNDRDLTIENEVNRVKPYCVECGKCKARGPMAFTPSEAVTLWRTK